MYTSSYKELNNLGREQRIQIKCIVFQNTKGLTTDEN